MTILHPRELRHLRNQMMHMLDETQQQGTTRLPGDDTWQPHCDVFVTDHHFHVVIELAGVNKRSVRVTTSEDHLEIVGQRNLCQDRQNAYYYTLEIESGRFSKRVPFFDEPVDSDHPEVTYDNGLLHIVFALKPSVERIIEIE